MKTQVSPVVAGIIVALAVGLVAFFLWKGAQVPPANEKGFEFKIETDPVKRQKGLDDLIRKDRADHGIQ